MSAFAFELLLQFFHRHHRQATVHGFFLATNPTELIVVDQFGDRPVRAADGAIGILAQLSVRGTSCPAHRQEQASGERISLPQNQLDGFRSP